MTKTETRVEQTPVDDQIRSVQERLESEKRDAKRRAELERAARARYLAD